MKLILVIVGFSVAMAVFVVLVVDQSSVPIVLFKQPVETGQFQPEYEFFVVDKPQTLPNTGMVVFKAARGGADGTVFIIIAPKSFTANPGEKIKLMVFEARSNNRGGKLQMFVVPKE